VVPFGRLHLSDTIPVAPDFFDEALFPQPRENFGQSSASAMVGVQILGNLTRAGRPTQVAEQMKDSFFRRWGLAAQGEAIVALKCGQMPSGHPTGHAIKFSLKKRNISPKPGFTSTG
jgi:hypothetical protein